MILKKPKKKKKNSILQKIRDVGNFMYYLIKVSLGMQKI